jgi:hypothetical protein
MKRICFLIAGVMLTLIYAYAGTNFSAESDCEKKSGEYSGETGVVCSANGKQVIGSGGTIKGGEPCGDAYKINSIPHKLLGKCGEALKDGTGHE